jgi:hypothetical protein
VALGTSEGRFASPRPARQARRIKIEAPLCAHCRRPAHTVLGEELYRGRDDLAGETFWRCDACDATCGSHRNGKPLGRPGNKQLRDARMKLRERFDPIWLAGIAKYDGKIAPGHARALCRRRLYLYLAHKLGLEPEEAHIAALDLEQCRAAWVALAGVTYDDARNFAKGLV